MTTRMQAIRWLPACLLLLALYGVSAYAQEIIIDDADAGFAVLSGSWTSSTTAAHYWGSDYLFRSSTTGTATGQVEWRPDLPIAGDYEVAVWYTAASNRAVDAPFTVTHRDGSDTQLVNQQASGAAWFVLGVYPFDAGTGGCVRLSNHAGPSVVIADAVRFRHVVPMQNISVSDPRLAFGGLLFADVQEQIVYLNRFPDVDLTGVDMTRALDTTGITLRVRTDSRYLHAEFIELPSFNLGDAFTVFQNGLLDKTVTGLTVNAESCTPGQIVEYEVVCPSYARVALVELQIDAAAQLLPAAPSHRPRYAAFGDSITHGYGQHPTSHQTYPWLLAQSRQWELFNLAVSGSTVRTVLGTLFDDEPLDVVTVLWGQNDWNSENNLPLFVSRYDTFLTHLRATHPTVGIYCITLIAGGTEVPKVDNGYTREAYRQAVRDIVAARRAAGDSNIHVLEGLDLTTPADLIDGIHLNVQGAANLAYGLARAIHVPGPSGLFFDLNRDGSIDALDVEVFAACAAGPAVETSAECVDEDFDGDGDVDQVDFGLLQRCFSLPDAIDRDCLH